MSKEKIIDEKYTIIKSLGYGDYEKIYLTEKINDDSHKKYTAKIIEKEHYTYEENKKIFDNEIKILKIITEGNKENNKYITKLYDYGEGVIKKDGKETKKVSYLVTDCASNKKLFYYIKSIKHLKEIHYKLIFKKILDSIQYLHELKICHQDIRIDNIILNENYEPILMNFGLASLMEDENKYKIKKKETISNSSYTCPEMWNKEKEYNGQKADIFSLGVLLFNLVLGKLGFKSSKSEDKLYKYIMNKDYDNYWTIIDNNHGIQLTEEFKKLYNKMISFNPEDRPSINEIINDSWMKEIYNLDEENKKKLENEIYNVFKESEIKINSDNETIDFQEVEVIHYDFRSSNRSISCEMKSFFKDNISIKNIKTKNLDVDNYITIRGPLRPIEFANELLNMINKKYENCLIETSQRNVKFNIIFETDIGDEDNEDGDFEEEEYEIKDCLILVKFYYDENGNLLIGFTRKEGDLDNYYDKFLLIKRIIKNILL